MTAAVLLVAAISAGCSTLRNQEKMQQVAATLTEANRQFSLENTPPGALPNDTRASMWIVRAIDLMPHSDVPFIGSDAGPGINDILSARGRYPELVTLLTRATADPALKNDPILLNDLGDAQQRIGATAAAQATYKKSVIQISKLMSTPGAVFPTNTPILLLLAEAEWNAGEHDQAIKNFAAVESTDEDAASTAENDEAYFMALDKVHLPQALAQAKKAVAAARQEGDDDMQGLTLDTQAWVEHQMGNDQDALMHEQESASLVPLQPDVQLHLAEICSKLQMNDEARIAYTRVLKISPLDPDARAGLNALPAPTVGSSA